MSQNLPDFRSGVVKPVECLKEGYALIKDQYWLFFGITVVGLLISGLVPAVLVGPMMCGIHMCLLQRMQGGKVEFGDFLKGFDYFIPGLIATLIQFVPMLIIIIPTYVLFIVMFMLMGATQQRGSDPTAALLIVLLMFVFFMVIMLVAVIIQAFFIFMYPLIVDKKLSGVDAVKTSLKAAKANLGGVIGLTLLNYALTFVGLLCCYVGALAIVPITMASYAVVYRKVFPGHFDSTMVTPNWQA